MRLVKNAFRGVFNFGYPPLQSKAFPDTLHKMRKLFLLFIALAGLGFAGSIVYYIDPLALELFAEFTSLLVVAKELFRGFVLGAEVEFYLHGGFLLGPLLSDRR